MGLVRSGKVQSCNILSFLIRSLIPGQLPARLFSRAGYALCCVKSIVYFNINNIKSHITSKITIKRHSKEGVR